MDVQNGALILYLVRSGRANDWSSLAQAFGLDPVRSQRDSMAYGLFAQLLELRAQELVEFKGDSIPIIGGINVTQRWAALQQALGRPKLKYLAAISGTNRGIAATPEFGPPGNATDSADVFVLMPFTAGLKPVYDDHIRKVASTLGLTAKRADDFFTNHAVMHDVWTGIFNAKWIVADCTGRNPNVFYEVGIAHTLGRKVVLITQNSEDVPFDLRHIRYIEYSYTPPGMKEFETRLAATMSATPIAVV
jgi:hypothetical protein